MTKMSTKISVMIAFTVLRVGSVGAQIKESPKKKYATAVVFEGGRTEGGLSDYDKQKPSWRLYLCMEPSEKPITRHVELDFKKLGNAPEVISKISEGPVSKSGELPEVITAKFRLEKSVISYTYTTRFDKFEGGEGKKFAKGDGSLKLSSRDTWSRLGVDGKNPTSYSQIGVFNMNTTERLGMGLSTNWSEITTRLYEGNGEKYYLSGQRVAFHGAHEIYDLPKNKQDLIMEECERQGKPHFFKMLDNQSKAEDVVDEAPASSSH